jgi:hypothetical protein
MSSMSSNIRTLDNYRSQQASAEKAARNQQATQRPAAEASLFHSDYCFLTFQISAISYHTFAVALQLMAEGKEVPPLMQQLLDQELVNLVAFFVICQWRGLTTKNLT